MLKELPSDSRSAAGSQPVSTTEGAEGQSRYSDLMKRIRSNDEAARGELFELLRRGIGFFLKRENGAAPTDDQIRALFEKAMDSLAGDRNAENPERMFAIIRLMLFQEASALRNREKSSASAKPEKEQLARARRVLDELPQVEREVLVRLYLREQPREKICQEMGLTEAQFRWAKSHAKDRFRTIALAQDSSDGASGTS